MKQLTLILISCCLIFLSFHQAMSLKCRTGNQQSDDQFQKIMQVCRRRYLGYDRENGRDYNGRETDSQESSDSDSDEDMFDNKFLSSAGSRYNKNGDKTGSGSRYDYAGSSPRNSTRQSSSTRYSSNRSSNNMNGNRSYNDNNGQMNSNRRNMRNSGMDSRGGYGDNNYSNRYNNNNNNNNMNRNNNNNNNNNNNDDNNNDGEREQACVTQCFFNELNLVDQRGFPERSAVIGIMTQNIQDPELRDFVEESVVECYHYLNNNGRQEKCQFSQNLLSCLAEKGSERCEDWDDE